MTLYIIIIIIIIIKVVIIVLITDYYIDKYKIQGFIFLQKIILS